MLHVQGISNLRALEHALVSNVHVLVYVWVSLFCYHVILVCIYRSECSDWEKENRFALCTCMYCTYCVNAAPDDQAPVVVVDPKSPVKSSEKNATRNVKCMRFEIPTGE